MREEEGKGKKKGGERPPRIPCNLMLDSFASHTDTAFDSW